MEKGFLNKELALERLERIAGNLPVTPLGNGHTLEFGRVETKLGEVYLAVGRGMGTAFEGVSWYGVYGFMYGDNQYMGRHAECDGTLTRREAQQQLLDDAAWQMRMFDNRDMLDKSFRLEK